MRNEDASQLGSTQAIAPDARDDADHLAAADYGPALGNTITGVGTITGATGTDMVDGGSGRIIAIEGAGGSDASFSAGKLEVEGQYGTLTIDADGNYSYVRNPGTPAGVADVFNYTLQGTAGASDTAKLIINIGDVPMLKTAGNQVVPGADGVVVLPAGVELSDVRVVGRDLVVTLPDGSTMVIVDGAIFVPQLVIDGVEVPASNLAALLIDSEPKPAAGDLSPLQQSSGGNFAVPVAPLDPGVPLGDLLPPTELAYTPPDFEEIGQFVDKEPVAGTAAIQLDDDDVPGKGGNAGGPNDDVGSPNATGGGFLPGSDGDGSLAWALLSSGAPSGFSYNLQPDGSIQVVQVQGGNNVVVLTISVNPGTGAYTVTENNPIRHATGDTENNSIFVINYTVTDDDGDIALGTLTINVDDDTPTVTVSAGSDANVLLITDDAQTIGAASDTAVSLADFSGVFGATSVSPGADGAGPGSSSAYSLNITGSVSGLSSHGNAINLFVLNGVVVGTTGGQPASLADANIVFTVSVSNTGVVTLTQLQQIDHPIASDPTASGAPFADHIVNMADGLVTLTRSETVVDNDGDSVTGSASVNIGANLRFTDDGPTVSGAQVNSSVTVDETNGAEPVSSGSPIVATSAAPIIVGGAVNYGADGQGPAPAYGLSLVNGTAIGTSIDSGLVTALGDHPITLTLTSATLITATYQDGGTQTAFTIQMNADGTVTVTQYTALEHGVDGPPGPAHDDALDLINGETNLVNATVTYQDFDGDTATASAAIGGAIIFRDDGPSVTISSGSDENILLVTGDDGTEGMGSTSDSTTADFAGAFSITGSNGGGDGTASTALLTYALSTVGGDSGLTSHGNTINLYMVGTTVVGAIGGQPLDLNDTDIVFTVSVSNTGVVTLTQLQQIDHPVETSPVPGTDAPFADQTISMLDDSLITLTATATITDNDGDSASDSESIDIAANLVFQDDGPTIDASLKQGASLHIDESLPGVDGAGETDAVGLGQVTVALSALIDVTESPVSADQPTTISGGTLVLGPDGGDGRVESGLTTSNGDLPIYLYNVGGVIFGSTALVAPVAVDANTVFTVAIVGGNVVMTQYQAIEHPTPGASHDENVGPLTSGALLLSVTGTDFDGDTDSDTVDLGSIITFGDDGPNAGADPTGKPVLTLDESAAGTDTPGGTSPVGDRTESVSIAGFFATADYGSDSAGTTSDQLILNLGVGQTQIGSGLYALDPSDLSAVGDPIGQGSEIMLSQSGNVITGSVGATVYFTITLTGSTLTFEQAPGVNLWHPNTGNFDEAAALSLAANTIIIQRTVTDSDGDTDTAVLDLSSGVFSIQDDGPRAVSPAAIASGLTNGGGDSETRNLDGGVGGNNNVFDNFGTDGGRVIFTAATITALDNQNLKFGGTELSYAIGSDGQLLTGFVDTDANGLDAGDITVFTIELQSGVDPSSTYTVTMHNSIDTVTNINFNDGTYDFVGGNDAWAGFVPLDQIDGKAGDAPINDDSKDLVLTPIGSGTAVNGNATSAGVTGPIAGQNIGQGEGMRLDFIEDLTGIGTPGDYNDVGEQTHDFDAHYGVNGAVLRFGQGTSTLTTSSFKAFVVSPVVIDDNGDDGTADLVDGTGSLISVTSMSIIYDGETEVVNFNPLDPTTPITVTVGDGDDGDGFADRTYTVTFVLDGVSNEYYATVQGIHDINVRIATFAESNYHALEVLHLGPDSSDADYAITGFGAATATNAPVDFTVPISVIDGDGDTISSGNLVIHADPLPPPPPIVLDMDGDGVEFIDRSAGVMFDYGAGLVSTAWVGPDDAILVRDANGNGVVDDAGEFVFGGNGATDMEALHAMYGEQLDASDADFTMFALWSDANSNGVVDQGEMQSLGDAGVASIGLVSDGQGYTAANDDVIVAGSATYTRTDGTTGDVADAAFVTGGVARTQEVERIAANSNSTVIAAAVAAAGMAASTAAAADPSGAPELGAAMRSALYAIEPVSVGDLSASTSIAALVGAIHDASATIALPLGSATFEASQWMGSVGELGQANGFDSALSSLGQGTDMIASQAALPTIAADVGMPSAEALATLDYGPVQTIDTVEMILVDALQGGGPNPIDAVLNGFGPGEIGGIAVLDGSASGFQAGVSTWDMGGSGSFTPAMPNVITTEALMLHHDAIQPAANG